MLVRAHFMRRLVDDGLTAEERRLADSQDGHDHHAGQDQSEAEDQYQPDPADTRAAAIIRGSAVPQRDDQDEEQSEAPEKREQELEGEVERVAKQLMAEEPDATEGSQPVVEADHDAERQDRVGKHTFADERHD